MRTTLAAAAACSLIATGTIITLTPATADAASCTRPTIRSTTIDPSTVVLGTSVPKGITVTTKIETNGCRIDRVQAGLYGPNFIDSYGLDRVDTSNGATTYETGLRISPGGLPNADAGRWTSYVTAWGPKTAEGPGPSFRVLRAARLTTNATPEPVRKGAKLTIKGSLTRANWESLTYQGYGNRVVDLQRRSAGGSYRTVKHVTSAANGALRTTVTATADACYRFVFAGSANTARTTSKGDCVDVRS
jgi:hypothetical protein